MSEKFQVPRTHCGYPLWHLLCEEFHYWKPIAQKKMHYLMKTLNSGLKKKKNVAERKFL